MDEARRLAARKALVTGSATGIGRSTVLRLTAEGASAIVNYVGPSDDADEVVEEVSRAGGRAVALQADVSDQGPVQAMFPRAAEELGGPAGLLCNNPRLE